MTQRDWQWRANNKLGQNRVSLKGMYVWGVNSKVTKQSDHYVWKDTSERVARHCDDIVHKKRENSCVLKHLVGGSWATKNNAKNPQKCSLRRATNVTFSKFRGWRRQKKSALLADFWNRGLWLIKCDIEDIYMLLVCPHDISLHVLTCCGCMVPTPCRKTSVVRL